MDTKPMKNGAPQTRTPWQKSKKHWQTDYAYHLGMQAYVWAYPWLYFSVQTAKQYPPPDKPGSTEKTPVPLNTLYRVTSLCTPEHSTSQSPNCDTLYTFAWLDLLREPVVLTLPMTKKAQTHLYVVQLAAMNSDNFGYISTQTTGNATISEGDKTANYLIAYKDWHGKVPDNVFDIGLRSPTPMAYMLGRVGVNVTTSDNKQELRVNEAQELQKQYKLRTLDCFCNHTPPPAPRYAPAVLTDDTVASEKNALNQWRTINQSLTQNPPATPPGIDQSALLNLFSQIGVGPGCDIDLMPAAIQKGLIKAAVDGYQFLRTSQRYLGKPANNWAYPSVHIGRAGTAGEYLNRAAMQALWGFVDQDPSEAVYINTCLDQNGAPLSAEHKYKIIFAPDGTSRDKDNPTSTNTFPPYNVQMHGFWSITLYDRNYHLIKGSKNYSINSYNPNFTPAPNGKLTILIQSSKPYLSPGTCWLQTPQSHTDNDADNPDFYLVLRIYAPDSAVRTTQSWQPPTVYLND